MCDLCMRECLCMCVHVPLSVYLSVCVWVYTYKCDAYGGQKEALDSQELEL